MADAWNCGRLRVFLSKEGSSESALAGPVHVGLLSHVADLPFICFSRGVIKPSAVGNGHIIESDQIPSGRLIS